MIDTPLLIQLTQDPAITEIVNGAPLPQRDELSRELLHEARRLIGTDDRDPVELATARESLIMFALSKIPPTVEGVAKAWNVPQPVPTKSFKRPPEEPNDLFNSLGVLMFVTAQLPDHKYEIGRVCARLKRESWGFPDDGYDESLRSRAIELCEEAKRKNLNSIEIWADNKARKGKLQRPELLKRLDVKTPLPISRRDAGFVYFDLSVLDIACDRLLCLRREDAAAIDRMAIETFVLKKGRGRVEWKILYKHVFYGRSGTQVTLRPLENLVANYSLVADDKRDEFSQEALDQTADTKAAKAIRNPVHLGESGTDWVGDQPPNDETGPSPFNSIDAESAVGIAYGGTRRPAGPSRAGHKHGSDDGEAGFVEATQAGSYERVGVTKHEDDDPTGEQEDRAEVNTRTRRDDTEGDRDLAAATERGILQDALKRGK